MRKTFTLVVVLFLSICGALTSNAQINDRYLLYAFMDNAASWSEGYNTEPYYGIYSFRTDGRGGFTPVSPIGYDYGWASIANGGGGGVYDDGYYYCFTVNGSWSNYSVKFSKVDTRTWSVAASNSENYISGSNPVLVPVDLTANPKDEKIYAVCRPKLANSDYGVLVTVDRNNGTLTEVARTPYYMVVASDAQGQLYAITSDGQLDKVNLDGTTQRVGSTGLAFFPKEQTATIDFRTGKMYLSHYGYEVVDGVTNYNNSVKGLYEIDLATAKATLLHAYDDYNVMSALSFMNSHPLAPDMIEDLTFLPVSEGALTGEVKFTVPSLTYDQQPITKNVEVNLYLDNISKGSFEAAPGQSFGYELAVGEEGNHTVKVILSANGHNSVQQEATFFFGIDSPKQVENLVLTASEDAMTATLTWDAPTETLNGGTFDPASVRYTIVRNPGNVTVQRAAKETTFTEQFTDEYCKVSYTVTPYIDGNTSKRGKAVRSNKVFLGSAWEMPYAEAFDYGDSWDSFTVIDSNGDGGEWGWEDPVWKFDTVYYCAFFYHANGIGAADDWLITPKLNFDSNKLYKITFQLYGYYEGLNHHLTVHTGKTATAESMGPAFYDEVATSTMTKKLTISKYFAPREGDLFVGFHNVTEDAQHVSIDNILIEEVGSSAVPAMVENLKAEAIDARAGKAKLSFTAPTKDAAGRDLSSGFTVKIYRGEDAEPIKTFTNVKTGENLSFDDNEAAKALNIYTVVPENDKGVGLEATVQIDLRAGEPASVRNVVAKLLSGGQVMLTWDAVNDAVDANGNAIDYTSMRYLVYRPNGDDYEVIGRNLKECQFVDDNPQAPTGSEQAALFYYVAAVNGDGESIASPSNVLYVGDPYKLPFAETWADGYSANNPWLRSSSATAGWVVTSKGYAPLVDGQDGLGLISLDLNPELESGMSTIWSPRIDLSDVKDAKLTFYMYGENTYNNNDYIQIALDIEGQGQVMTGASFCPKRWAGWKQQTVDLTPYVGNERVSVIFIGKVFRHENDEERRIHLDNVKIEGTPADNEVKVASFTGSSQVRATVPSKYQITVANVGASDADAMPVNLYADDELVATATVPYLASGESATVEVEYTPADSFDDVIELRAEIEPAADGSSLNNSKTLAVEVRPLNLPYVTDLSGAYNSANGSITLNWSAPSKADSFETVVDGAEAYDAFAIENVGCWSLYDGDVTLPFKFQDPTSGVLLEWENNDQKQAWMVFRPSDVTSDRTFQANDGQQLFASWAAAGTQNNDWLISPELSGEAQLISFFVRRLNERDTEERYNVLYSTTDNDPASFSRINGDTPLSAPAEWTLVNFTLPEGAKYFAIQYVGYNQSALFVDDVQYEGYPTHMRPDSYNVYRDGVKINKGVLGRTSYEDDEIPADKISRYIVRPVYAGTEAPESNEFVVDPSGVDFTGSVLTSVNGGVGYISIAGAMGQQSSIYTIDGKIVLQKTLAADSEMFAVGSGIYVVKVGAKTFKVIVR